jgi:uncharacterized membrane protein
MQLEEFWTWLEMTPLAARIGESAWFPFLESMHVLSAMFVVGTVLMADLRLLGWSARRYSVTVITDEVVPWTWGAFAIAGVTGVGLLMPRASSYVANPAFLTKVVLLALALVNMLTLHFFALRTERVRLQMTTGACSLLVWAGVVLAGRWIGHLS